MTTRGYAAEPDLGQVIEKLYAAGLELQVLADQRDSARCRTAMLPGCVQRIADLMADLQHCADVLSPVPDEAAFSRDQAAARAHAEPSSRAPKGGQIV